MPRCQGIPRCNGPPFTSCPDNRNDSSVKMGEGELMLCASCDAERHRQFVATHPECAVPKPMKDTKHGPTQVKHVTAQVVDGAFASVSPPLSSSSTAGTSASSDVVPKPTKDMKDGTAQVVEGVSASVSPPLSSSPTAGINALSDVVPNSVLEVDEVLFFMKSAFIRGMLCNLKTVAMSFYNGEELAMSKAKLQKTAEVLGVRDLKRLKKRTGTNKVRAEVDDIANILQLIDEQGLLDKLPVYVAANIDRVPMFPLENLDVVVMAKKNLSL